MDAGALLTLLITAIVLLIWRDRRKKKQLQAKIERAADALRTYVEQVNAAGAFTPAENHGLALQKNEFPVLAEPAKMYEYRAQRSTRGAGTRVMVGKLPVYLGGSVSQSVDKLREASSGTLYLTNKRLAFVGAQKTFASPLNGILSIDNALTHITVSANSRQKPLVFTVQNGFFWNGLFSVLNQWELDSPALPGKINLT